MNDPVLIGQLRKDSNGIDKLFEAVRVTQALGHDVSISLNNEPIPAPEGEEREWEKEKREANGAVMFFWAENGKAL